MARTRLQDETQPLCVWVTSDPNEDEVRCARPAKYEYKKRVEVDGRLPTIDVYTMCGKHASEKNRSVAKSLGYTVREIPFATPS